MYLKLCKKSHKFRGNVSIWLKLLTHWDLKPILTVVSESNFFFSILVLNMFDFKTFFGILGFICVLCRYNKLKFCLRLL